MKKIDLTKSQYRVINHLDYYDCCTRLELTNGLWMPNVPARIMELRRLGFAIPLITRDIDGRKAYMLSTLDRKKYKNCRIKKHGKSS